MEKNNNFKLQQKSFWRKRNNSVELFLLDTHVAIRITDESYLSYNYMTSETNHDTYCRYVYVVFLNVTVQMGLI